MRHDLPVATAPKRTIFASRRFQLVFTSLLAGLIPYVLRVLSGVPFHEPAIANALWFNALAVIIAFWVRLSIEPYPGIRQSYVIFPAAAVGHGTVLFILVMTRLPYDRVGLVAGFAIHVLLAYVIWFSVQRRIRLRIGVVPFGAASQLMQIPSVDWVKLSNPSLPDLEPLDAIVVDLSRDMPADWERMLADAAVAGLMVYHAKQLAESLTGRVQIRHLSENNFGMLIPGRGYFYLKMLVDFGAAFVVAPIALPMILVVATVIRLVDGKPALFRQERIGRSGAIFMLYKFRTMATQGDLDSSRAALAALATEDRDPRVTRLGAFLRKTRIDELPQIINILRGEMSWIGPRPEPHKLTSHFVAEIPFYRYRHVVKPGITGWAQVNQGYVSGIDKIALKLQYDFYYIKNFSPWLDVLITFKTVKTMITGSGAR
jgi:lipopolysaccharide/colanic/teichoic acid biosynthesis glycosyltransferase